MGAVKNRDSEPPQADQRTNLRAPLIIQKILLDSERPAFFGYSKSISRSGIFIATSNQLKVGARINLQIPLPAPLGMTIKCCCEVVWRRPASKKLPFEPGMGLKFIDLPEEISALLDNWVHSQNG